MSEDEPDKHRSAGLYSQQGPRRLTVAAGLHMVRVGDGVVLSSPTATLKLEGGVADLVASRLLPALNPDADRRALVGMFSDVSPTELDRVISHLVGAGLVVETAPDESPPPDWLTLVSGDLDERRGLARRLASRRIVVLGSSTAALALASTLHDLGAGSLRLAVPEGTPEAVGRGPSAPDVPRESTPVTQGDIAALVVGADTVVVVTDASLPVLHVWANTAALGADVPVVHAFVNGTSATVGPLVLPGEGPCYLCWRMRALACADDFATAMAMEEEAASERAPRRQPQPEWPTLASRVAAALAHEVLAVTISATQPRLAGHVLEIDGRSQTSRLHAVLPRPDCPACSKKDRPPRTLPSLGELAKAPRHDTPFDVITETVVNPLCGVIRVLERIPKDVEEPELPVIVRAELANALFSDTPGSMGCSGKGPDLVSARNTAVAEALERHASLTWLPTEVVTGTRADLLGPSLDPRELVLYADDQYDHLPYTRYEDSTALDWVPARSLVSGERVWVPLDGVHLSQRSGHHTYLFPATSNGFAAGADLTSAVLSALLEVVERDAFLITWAHRITSERHAATQLADDEGRGIALAYARRGVDIDVHLLPTDCAATVALAVGWNDDLPAAVIGLGASLDPVDAARRAVLEVGQVRPALRARLRQRETHDRMTALVADPSLVTELEDHDLLYADPAMAATGLGFLRDQPRTPWPAFPAADTTSVEDSGPGAALTTLVSSLAAVADDVLYVDATSEDIAPLGITVARAVVTGFQPIHFGAGEMRLGHPRLRTAPVRMGRATRAAHVAELNPLPHPLA